MVMGMEAPGSKPVARNGGVKTQEGREALRIAGFGAPFPEARDGP